MSELPVPLSRSAIKQLIIIGVSIWLFFTVGFGLFVYYVMRHGGVDVFIATAFVCILPFLPVSIIYSGYFVVSLARGRWKFPWLWGVAAAILTILLLIGLPATLSPFFPYQSPVIFLYAAPVLSTVIFGVLVTLRKV